MASDLLFLAVRYIAGELPADELAAFEDRLDHDQAAREAVAQAVELADALAQLPATTPSVLPMPRRRTLAVRIAAVAAAASVVIAAGIVLRMRHVAGPAPEAPGAVVDAGPTGSLALAWSGLRQSDELDMVTHSDLLAWLDEPAGSQLADALVLEPSEGDDEGLPLWLLEATSLREPTPPEGRAREN